MSNLVVLVSGKQGSGKTSLADALAKSPEITRAFDPNRIRFASILYKIHDAARDTARSYGIPYPTKFSPLLQILGTELGRNMFGENIWVDALKNDISQKTTKNHRSQIFIIDDARFLNEIEAFDGEGSIVDRVIKIRLEAPTEVRKKRCDAWRDNDTHPSETSLDDYDKWDCLVRTDVMTADETLDYILARFFR